MWQLILRGIITGAVVVAVTELAHRSPKLGAFVLTLPLVSIIALVSVWQARHDLANVSALARETLVLVPLGLPFFVPIALAPRLGLGFWPSFLTGLAAAAVTVGGWLWLGPRTL